MFICHPSTIGALYTMMASNCVKAHSSAEILMVLSPAKTLDLSPGARRLSGHWTLPNCNDAKTKQIAAAMKIRTAKELEGLLGISSNLATTAHKVSSRRQSDALLAWSAFRKYS